MKRYYSLFHKPLVLAGLWLALLLFGQPSSTYAQVGQIWAWGDNTYGEIGQGYFPWSTTPTKVLNITNVIKVAVGDYHTLALKSDGTVWAWVRLSHPRPQIGWNRVGMGRQCHGTTRRPFPRSP